MKPGIGVRIGLPPMDPSACAPEGCNDTGRIGSSAFASPEWKRRNGSKAQQHGVICVASCYDAPSARVFDAWLDPEVAGQWLFATASRPMARAEIDARVEGSFRFMDRREGEIIEYTGEYIEIIPHRRLVFTLSMEKHLHVMTRVTVEIFPLNKGCELTLTHEKVPQEHASQIEGRWIGILYGLGVTLDSASIAFHNDQE